MNPSVDQVASIRQFVAGLSGQWSNTNDQILAAMAATKVANPIATQPTIPKPFTFGGLLGVLSPTSMGNLNKIPAQGTLIADIRAGDVATCNTWIAFLVNTSLVTSAEATALSSIVNATEPDPSWTAEVGWDVGTLGRACDQMDLQIARQS